MTRQTALDALWKRLFFIFALLLSISITLASFTNSYTVPLIVFITGNIGGYVGFHRRLANLADSEIQDLAQSWFAMALPSFIGGILACLLYIIFISGIAEGTLFPKISPDNDCAPENLQRFVEIFCQHAEGYPAYAKLLFWSFVAGFNQNYVVDLIETMKKRAE
ncbi:hypothetical protein PPUJ20028_42340 [Pseudomonas putida]|uniref:Uncharacterized protein n=1 Tax=Pseudomonas putida TaxID=303 RepID=A0AA37RFX5_PSEPU|nr:hypothetical protein [Pseudomonas putida]GLO15649.1 hypothetical protein PPUJ20028_42340 [Pseudomonas putida]GLO37181.1 hypothetical protein PPUN14671_40170 [Pseudomonas putida]HDS0964983.1 hypothetical protein [Pseudomonas putida]HDS0991365.1 hypothetical protein [Pseudomonas putida]